MKYYNIYEFGYFGAHCFQTHPFDSRYRLLGHAGIVKQLPTFGSISIPDWEDSDKFKGTICYGGFGGTFSTLTQFTMAVLCKSLLVKEFLRQVMEMSHVSWTFGTSECLLLDRLRPSLLWHIVAYCGSFQDFQRFTKHMMQQACTYYVWVQGLSSPICAGAGAYAFENVRTSVEHGCRHVGLPERRALEKSQKRGLDYFRLVDGV